MVEVAVVVSGGDKIDNNVALDQDKKFSVTCHASSEEGQGRRQ